MIKKVCGFFLLILALTFSIAIAAVDINKADVATLKNLPGIGETKAKAIVEYREKNGPFKTVQDLDKVKGIGPKMMEKLKDQVTVGAGTQAPSTPATKPAK